MIALRYQGFDGSFVFQDEVSVLAHHAMQRGQKVYRDFLHQKATGKLLESVMVTIYMLETRRFYDVDIYGGFLVPKDMELYYKIYATWDFSVIAEKYVCDITGEGARLMIEPPVIIFDPVIVDQTVMGESESVGAVDHLEVDNLMASYGQLVLVDHVAEYDQDDYCYDIQDNDAVETREKIFERDVRMSLPGILTCAPPNDVLLYDKFTVWSEVMKVEVQGREYSTEVETMDKVIQIYIPKPGTYRVKIRCIAQGQAYSLVKNELVTANSSWKTEFKIFLRRVIGEIDKLEDEFGRTSLVATLRDVVSRIVYPSSMPVRCVFENLLSLVYDEAISLATWCFPRPERMDCCWRNILPQHKFFWVGIMSWDKVIGLLTDIPNEPGESIYPLIECREMEARNVELLYRDTRRLNDVRFIDESDSSPFFGDDYMSSGYNSDADAASDDDMEEDGDVPELLTHRYDEEGSLNYDSAWEERSRHYRREAERRDEGYATDDERVKKRRWEDILREREDEMRSGEDYDGFNFFPY